MNGKGTSQKMLRKLLTLDLTQYAITEIQVGPDQRGPARCLQCRRQFKQGEVWRRLTSAAAPQYGRYTVGIHNKCPTKPTSK